MDLQLWVIGLKEEHSQLASGGEREFLVFQSKLDLEKAVSESLDRLLISLMCMVLFHLRS